MPTTRRPPETIRQCYGCKMVRPLTVQNFAQDSRYKNGFHTRCHRCAAARKAEWAKRPPAPPRAPRPPELERTCLGCKGLFPLEVEHFARHASCRGGFSARCRDCVSLGKKATRLEVTAAEAEARRRELRGPLRPGQRCDECAGLSHRRPRAGCTRCKGAYAPLEPLELVTHRAYEPRVCV